MDEFSKNRSSSWPAKSKFWKKKLDDFSRIINYLRKLVLKSQLFLQYENQVMNSHGNK